MTESEGSLIIKPIEKDVVNQICSGQVILSLATAVKELVENSIDAKATSIQVRLKEYGAESVEVIDNGSGVEQKNFQALTLKHYTSKITDFADVASVETFGFRGEALSSLCTLSKVTITTKHRDSESATKLRFDHNGIIVESSKIARQTGTTVMLENIFYTLPVRHKEFQRNIRKEFGKMCNVLYAYGLLCKGISIVCTNQVSKKRLTVMESMGETLRSNITQIFGGKQSQNLLEIKETLPEDSIVDDDNDANSDKKLVLSPLLDIKLEGFISSCAHGAGRSSSDRQFYYINSRPVDNVKVTKLVNDIYRQYNPHQYPFIVLNMKLLMECVDVNVTPDKRLIFMKNEKHLLSTVEASLHKLFQNIPAVLKIQNIGGIAEPKAEKPEGSESTFQASPLEKLKKFRSSSYCNASPKRVEKKSDTGRDAWKSLSSRSTFARTPSVREIFINPSPTSHEKSHVKIKEESGESKSMNGVDSSMLDVSVGEDETKSVGMLHVTEVFEPVSSIDICLDQIPQAAESTCCKRKAATDVQHTENNALNEKNETKRVKTDDGMTDDLKRGRKSVTLDVRLHDIRARMERRLLEKSGTETNSKDDDVLLFYAQITPSQNESAEKELMRQLRKESFKEMRIIGQFNLGFIIAALGPDVFIIDQHATDEKYNFEALQRTTKIQTQRLVVPQSLNLTIEKEELMLHHADVIKQNGFDFDFNSEEAPTNRVKLTCVPLSKNWVFGKEDIDEMLFILENALDGKICRPSRVRAMFASRACRKSVMIGTALNHFEMRRLVDHMGEIEQPWNCPHGRPTIRHLINLNLVKKA